MYLVITVNYAYIHATQPNPIISPEEVHANIIQLKCIIAL